MKPKKGRRQRTTAEQLSSGSSLPTGREALNITVAPVLLGKLEEIGQKAEASYLKTLMSDVTSVEAMEGLGLLALRRDDLCDVEKGRQASAWLKKILRFQRTTDVLNLLGLSERLAGSADQAPKIF
jgi:hypothetical protein